MKTNVKQRACDRLIHTALISVSYFNKEHCFDAQTLNHCADGLCFKSSCFLQPGGNICIRVKKFDPSESCTGLGEGLRTITIGEIKWCKEIAESGVGVYKVGVRYFPPAF